MQKKYFLINIKEIKMKKIFRCKNCVTLSTRPRIKLVKFNRIEGNV